MKPLLLRTFTLSIVYASLAMRPQATDSVGPIAAKLNKILGMLMYSIIYLISLRFKESWELRKNFLILQIFNSISDIKRWIINIDEADKINGQMKDEGSL